MPCSGIWRMAYALAFAALMTGSQAWGAGPQPITCGSAPEGATFVLRCATGQTVNDVTFASFGRPTGTCGTPALTISPTCHLPVSRGYVQALCMGKASCILRVVKGASAGGVTLTDPCPGKAKVLAARVSCAPKPGS
jgi:hypothetical protein